MAQITSYLVSHCTGINEGDRGFRARFLLCWDTCFGEVFLDPGNLFVGDRRREGDGKLHRETSKRDDMMFVSCFVQTVSFGQSWGLTCSRQRGLGFLPLKD